MIAAATLALLLRFVTRAGALDAAEPPAPSPAPQAAAVAAVDPVELWMSTYHLDPTPERIPEMVGALVSRGAFAADAPRAREFVRFFAAAASRDPQALAEVAAAAVSAEGPGKALLLAIAAKAGHYAPPVVEAPGDLPQLWAEYRATGEPGSLAALCALLALPPEQAALAAAAEASLLEQAPRHKGARTVLNDLLRGASGELRERLGPVVGRINERATTSEVVAQRGRSHERAGQKEQAVATYLAAIDHYPTNTQPYLDIGDLYLDSDDKALYPRAQAVLEVAAALEPDNPRALAYLGRAHFRMQQFDQAVLWLTRARERNPKYAYAAHYLGRVRLRMDDTAGAIRSFREYLALEPAGDRLSKKEREVLAAAGVAAAKEPETTLPGLLLQERYDDLAGRLAAIVKERPKERGGAGAVFVAFANLVELPGPLDSSEKWVARIEGWAQRQPTLAVAQAAAGLALIEWAWEARGGGWGGSVLDEQHRLFKERLLAARERLEKAYELDPANPAVPSGLMTVAMGLGSDREEKERQFRRAVAADPTVVEPYGVKVTWLLPKWGGSLEETLAFAREAAAQAPPGSAVPLVLFKAHHGVDKHLRDASLDAGHYRAPGVWAELKPMFEGYLRTFPEAFVTRNWFAFVAWRAGDLETARREIDLLGDEWSPEVWGGYSGLKKARREIAAAAARPAAP